MSCHDLQLSYNESCSWPRYKMTFPVLWRYRPWPSVVTLSNRVTSLRDVIYDLTKHSIVDHLVTWHDLPGLAQVTATDKSCDRSVSNTLTNELRPSRYRPSWPAFLTFSCDKGWLTYMALNFREALPRRMHLSDRKGNGSSDWTTLSFGCWSIQLLMKNFEF